MDTEETQEIQEIQVHEEKQPETTEIDVDNLPQPPPKRRALTDAQKQAARERVLKAAERKTHYRKIRQELGLGARDPIPEKYKLPTKVREKVVFEESDAKEIVKEGEVKELREESKATKVRQEHERALGISAKASSKSQREKALSREAKELRISQVVRQAVDEALLHRSAIKSHLKSQYIDKPQERPKEARNNPRGKPAEQRGSMRMRLPDGRVLQL